jgi:hypothetical protein
MDARCVATLQHAVRGNAQERYREFAEMVNARLCG